MTLLLDTLDEVGATARWTAAARALEGERSDALLDDPWAARLAGDDGMAWLARQVPGATLPMVLRARYFDDWLRASFASGVPRQTVLLGAGLDTRAWRLLWPMGSTVFEVDRADALEPKACMLNEVRAVPACRRIAVAADLGGAWGEALVSAGFDRSCPTVWLAEGVLFYLPNALLRAVLAEITRRSAPGSRLGFDIPNRAVLTSPWTRSWVEMQAAAGAPWLGTMDDPAAELAALGWNATVSQPGEGESGHGRWTLPVLPAGASELPHTWYVTAVRAE